MHIWVLIEAGKMPCNGRYELYCPYSITSHHSSLKKIRKIIKDIVRLKQMSIDNWIKEEWRDKDRCTVINSGGEYIFAFKRIEVL